VAPAVRRLAALTVLTVALGASVWIFLGVDAGSHSVSDTLDGVVAPISLVWLAALAVLAIVRRTMTSP